MVLIALLAAGLLYMSLAPSLAIGPRYLQLVIILALAIPAMIAHRRHNVRLNALLGHAVGVVTTAFMIWSIALLLRSLVAHTEAPLVLLRSGAALWVTNVLVFAHWYWQLDAGGPHDRLMTRGHSSGSFLFPQMTFDPASALGREYRDWEPHFVDYLFLAFNTSTAFSATDTAVLTKWAKVLTMIQALISLVVIGVLVARSINIL